VTFLGLPIGGRFGFTGIDRYIGELDGQCIMTGFGLARMPMFG
jgi:hypothetical protein